MIRRAVVYGALASALTLMAWGCGDDDGSTTSSDNTSSSSTSGSGGSGGAASSSTGGPVSSSTTGGGGMSSVNGNCAMPYDIMLGDGVWGDTNNGTDDLSGPCQAGSDVETVFRFTADATGTLTFTLTSDADLGMYVLTSCDTNPDSVIACTDAEFGAGAVETLTVNVENGTTYFLVVDAYEPGQSGNFQLDVGAAIGVEICDNGMDDNGNLVADCEDPGCATDATCVANIAAACMGATALTPGMQQSGDTTSGSNVLAGTCSGFGAPEVLYSYTPATDEIMSVAFQSATDQGMYLRSTCEDADTQLACTDAQVGGTDELLRHVFLTGATPITMVVDGYMGGEQGPYTFTASTAATTEAEPNDDYMTANAFAAGYTGYIPSGDSDFIAITMASPGNLTVSTDDVFAGDCAASLIDTEVELFDTDGTTSLQFNDDIDEANGNYCASVTAMSLAAGTYYVRVRGSQTFCPNCTMGYVLGVTMN